MTDDDELKQLFERTAREPSSFELTRMAARARELPSRLERVPRRLPRWTWGHAFAAVAALGALGVALTEVPSPEERASPPERDEPAPSALALRASSDPSGRAEHSPLASPPAPTTDDDVDLDALSFGTDLDDDPFDLSSAEETELSK